MMMRRLPDIAIRECFGELRAACRLPIDQQALDVLMERVRPNFERILGHPDGPRRWADHGQRMRDNGRHVGALADFYGNRDRIVGAEALNRAFHPGRRGAHGRRAGGTRPDTRTDLSAAIDPTWLSRATSAFLSRVLQPQSCRLARSACRCAEP